MSIVWPQRFAHHWPFDTHSHLPLLHARPSPQSVEHARGALQLSFVVSHLSAHTVAVGSGVHELVTLPASSTVVPPSPPSDASKPRGALPSMFVSARCALSKSTPATAWHATITPPNKSMHSARIIVRWDELRGVRTLHILAAILRALAASRVKATSIETQSGGFSSVVERGERSAR